MRILEPKNAFWKGAKKHRVKKVVESKNALYKSCQKFYILGGDFFYFDENSKMRVLQPKNVILEGAKKHEVKKVIISKNAFSKSCPKFYKLGDKFFLF